MRIRIKSPVAGLFVRELNIAEGCYCELETLIGKILVEEKHGAPFRAILSPATGTIEELFPDNQPIKKGDYVASIDTELG
jgi:hypothetical protein